MIEFTGRATGEAEKFFVKSSREVGYFAMGFAFAVLFIPMIIVVLNTHLWVILIGYVIMCALIFLGLFIPPTKKELNRLMPHRIFIEEEEKEYIVCQNDIQEEYSLIADADKLIDYGEFYYVHFPMGRKTNMFICQKNLLTKGTLEEFEALFEGKIERKVK